MRNRDDGAATEDLDRVGDLRGVVDEVGRGEVVGIEDDVAVLEVGEQGHEEREDEDFVRDGLLEGDVAGREPGHAEVEFEETTDVGLRFRN